MTDLPSFARVVVVGGGVSGCSVAYHLAKLGWTDVVLLERKQLTSGTTWHAAGLVGQLRASQNMTRLAKYSADLYRTLEAETGLAVKTDKGDFIGREAVLRKTETGLERRLMQFRLPDPALHLHHNEPLLRDGAIVGFLTSGGYGHALGGAIGLGYVPCTRPGEPAAEMLASHYQIEIAGHRVTAEASLKPIYDPKSMRPKGQSETQPKGADDERPNRCEKQPETA